MKSSFAAVAAAVALAAGAAWAQEAVIPPEPTRHQALELKLGGFKPMIGSEAGLTGNPYDQVFGATAMLLFEVEVDRYLYQGIGAAGIAVSIGYAEKYGHALVASSGGATASAETAGFFVLPIRVGGVYRFDWAALKYGVPLVPYLKAGLVYTPWWTTKGGQIEYADGKRGAGGRFGYGGTAGLGLMLDVLEPRLARDFAVDVGVKHSYLFAEFTYEDVNDFGQPGLDLSSRHWMFGVSFDF